MLTMRGSTKTKTTISRPIIAIGFFRIHPSEMSAGFYHHGRKRKRESKHIGERNT